MGVNIDVKIEPEKIMQSRGLGRSGDAWLYAASRAKLYMDEYVPMQTGTLKNTAVCVKNGSGAAVQYVQPYAHYQYYGKVMGPNVLTAKGWRSMAPKGGKYYTGKALTYNQGGSRGAKWDERMMADRKGDMLKDVKAYIGGSGK